MHEFNYSALTNRNFLFIGELLQNKIKQTSLVFAGCGLSSVLAEMAARIGFTKFVLLDFDNVELSNINRQAFYLSDINKHKVDVLGDRLLDINPEIELTKCNTGINNEDMLAQVINSGNIIINTIDFGELYFKLVHDAMQQDKLVICPFNPGYGGLIVCFTKYSGNLYDLLGTDRVEEGLEFSRKLILNNLDIKLPSGMRENLETFASEIVNRGYESQMCIGVHMSSSMALACMLKYLYNEDIPVCPEIFYREVY